MRWLVLFTVILLCGCMETQKVIQREYVCSNGQVVDSPGICTTTSTTPPLTIPPKTVTVTSVTSTTTQPTTTTDPDTCASLSKNKKAACIAIRERNASLCPFRGLEYSEEPLTDSLFLALGEDIFSEEKKALIIDVFAQEKTCVMAIISQMSSIKECDSFPVRELCSEKFIADANDTRLCDAIKQGPRQQGCYFALIRMKANPEACFKYPEYQDCLVKMASESDDYMLCRQQYNAVSNGEKVPECIAQAKRLKCLRDLKSPQDCCIQLPEGMRRDCYTQKLSLTNNPIWCKKRVSSDIYETDWECMSNMARQRQDSGICEQIMPQDTQDDCYLSIISLSGNRTLCNQIRDDAKRRDCTWGRI